MLQRAVCFFCPCSRVYCASYSTRRFSRPRLNRIVKKEGLLSSKAPADKTPTVPRKNLLQETKIQAYLDHIAATSQDVTLADIERHKISEYPSPRSPAYEAQYNTLVATLLRSFSLNQFRKFLDMYRLEIPKRSNKLDMAVAIIERQWNLPSLTSIKKEEKERIEVISHSFALDVKEAFLILGKDGEDLLNLSSEFDAHISFSTNPLSLHVEGLRGSLDKFGEYISDFKTGIKEELLQLPPESSVGLDTLQRISRMSGAFADDIGNGLIRFSLRSSNENAARLAKILTLRAAVEVEHKTPTLVNSYRTSSEPSPGYRSLPISVYSLYPFLSVHVNSSMLHTANLFRVRHVGDWLRSTSNKELQLRGGLNDGQTLSLSGTHVELRRALLTQVDENVNSYSAPKIFVTASFGHLLVSSEKAQKPSLTSPLKVPVELPQVLKYLQGESVKKYFVSCLPHSLINIPPTRRQLIRRFLYYSCPGTGSDDSSTTKALKLELVLNPLASVGDGGKLSNEVAVRPICSEESFRRIDLMLPDCVMDVRLSMNTSCVLSEDRWPADLQSYFGNPEVILNTDMAVRPDIPLILYHEGTMYRLESVSTVRQAMGIFPKGLHTMQDSSVQMITENAFNVDTQQMSRSCEVTCEDIRSDSVWSSFVQYCDALVAPTSSESAR